MKMPKRNMRFLWLLYFQLPLRSEAVINISVGVLGISQSDAPYDIERIGPAIDIAFEKANRDILNADYHLEKIGRTYGPDCGDIKAPGLASDLRYNTGIYAMIGPACALALDDVARLSGYWDIPVLTGLGDWGKFKNKANYPTLTRFAYCQCRLRKVFGSVFKKFGWTDIAVIYDLNDEASGILGDTLKDGFQKGGIFPHMISYYQNDNPNYEDLLTRASLDSRVILLIVPGDALRRFMLQAYDMGFIKGEYVFMDVELFPFPGEYWGSHDWRKGDSRDPDAKSAYEALLRVSLHQPIGPDWDGFVADVKQRAAVEYDFIYGDEEVNFFAGAFHDAVILYATVLNETLSLNPDPDVHCRAGFNMTRKMWGRVYTGISGDVIIDDNGDRDTSYSIQDMDSVTGDFRVVANYWGDRPKYNPVDGVEIHWPITGIPPKNTPRCGFDGLDPVCNERGPLPLYAIIMIVFIVLIVIVAVIAYIIYRKLRLESELNNMSWRVSYDDIKMTDRINGSIASSRNALRSSFISNDESGTEVGEQSFAKIGIYKGTVVAIKQTKREKIRVTRDVLIEVKTVRDMAHDNITRFVGASLDPNKICILTEYCNKGSLQDLLANDSIKLDWSFRLSLLQDLVRGMVFVHNSDLKSHGRLRSSNCVVDSRFILKITDFGLHSFYGDEADDEKNHAYKEKLLWQAPELVRMKSSLSAGSAAGDVYSFGIILHEMSSRDQPYFVERCVLEVEDIIDRIVALQDPPFRPKTPHEGVPDGFLELMQKCWSEIPENRPDFNGISVVLRKLMSGRGGGKNIMDTLLQRMEQYATNLEGIVHERTQQLVCEQKKSEELLNQILPSSIAGQLKLGKAVEPESFDCVTIFFSDIVGFTKMSSESTPLQVVNFLNDLYTAFDAIIDQYDVYKVETIGDAYMVVSGLPISNGQNHAVEIARMSLALLDFIKGFKIKHRPDDQLQLRIGIHSGSCVAGVVGLKMPRYCLFGDTVNMTSRMESNGQALKIHVSPFTKDILDGFGTFTLELRGEIEMKGKGAVTTYWLLGETVKPPTP